MPANTSTLILVVSCAKEYVQTKFHSVLPVLDIYYRVKLLYHTYPKPPKTSALDVKCVIHTKLKYKR